MLLITFPARWRSEPSKRSPFSLESVLSFPEACLGNRIFDSGLLAHVFSYFFWPLLLNHGKAFTACHGHQVGV